MKLRIKDTGELLEDVKFIDTTLRKITIQYLDDGVLRECVVKNLSDIEEVKDYEEPKVGYIIDPMEEDYVAADDSLGYEELDIERAKELGIWFETKGEAEKAVEKLKAIARLRSCRFKFKGWRTADLGADKYYFVITAESDGAGKGDLDLLFGGEE